MDFLDGETFRQLLVAIVSIIPANLLVQAGFDKRNPVTDLDRYSSELDLLRSLSDNLQEGSEVDGTAGGGETPQGANRGIAQLGRDVQLVRSARLIADRELLEASRQNEKGFKKSLLATSVSLAALFTLLIVVSPADREWTFNIVSLLLGVLVIIGGIEIINSFRNIPKTRLQEQAELLSNRAKALRNWSPGPPAELGSEQNSAGLGKKVKAGRRKKGNSSIPPSTTKGYARLDDILYGDVPAAQSPHLGTEKPEDD